jgi:Fe2+ or Zn2+ uptake regulation protein
MRVKNEIAKTKPTVMSVFNENRNVGNDDYVKLQAHFRCKRCGMVCSIPLDESDYPKFRGAAGVTLTGSHIYFLGTCKKCCD